MRTSKCRIIAVVFFITLIFPRIAVGQSSQQKALPQFRFNQFSKGIIKMKDGRLLKATMDYNMVNEEMIFQQGSEYMVLDKPEEIDTVYISGSKFIPMEKCFYEVIWEGPVSIFIQDKAKYTQVPTTTAYGMKSPTNATINVTSIQGGNQVRDLEIPENVTIAPATIYWVKVNGTMNKFTNEKQFLKIFPNSEDKIKEFIKASKIDIKSPEGLAKLGSFCNELQK
jgi:hypothetical protein